MENTALGHPSCAWLVNYAITFERIFFYKNRLFSRIAMNLLVSFFCDSNVRGGRLERTHTHKPTTITLAVHSRRGLNIMHTCIFSYTVYLSISEPHLVVTTDLLYIIIYIYIYIYI